MRRKRYGYKWSKQLIAIASLYIGSVLGIGVTVLLLKFGVGLVALWAIPIITIIVIDLAYKSIIVNHFIAGFLLSIKLAFLFIMTVNQISYVIPADMFLILPILIGIIAGIFVVIKANNSIVLLCISFIGVTEFVPKLFDMANKTLFAATGDINFIFNPQSFILGLIGIDIPSVFEGIVIVLAFIASYWYQKNKIDALGINLSGLILDDRNI